MASNQTDVRTLFSEFMQADTAELIGSLFGQLCSLVLGDETPFSYCRLRDELLPCVSFIHQQLFNTLNVRWTAYAPQRAALHAASGRPSIVVSGAGPCGLRAAAELALLGFDVTLVEKRRVFSRHNILKTWTATVNDLLALGFKSYFPQFKPHGLHAIGTREIQICLLKSGLLLGVRFLYGEATAGIVPPSDDERSWRLVTSAAGFQPIAASRSPCSSSQTPTDQSNQSISDQSTQSISDQSDLAVPDELALKVGEQNAERLTRTSKVDFFEPAISSDGAVLPCMPSDALHTVCFDGLLLAEGESSTIVRNLGFDRQVTRFGPAIGLVVNVAFDKTCALQRSLPEFVATRSQADWAATAVGRLQSCSGVEIENIEYLRFSTHFIVCTVKKSSLHAFGVVRELRDTVRQCLAGDNVDLERLRALARLVADVCGVPSSCPLAEHHGVHVFDFSCKARLTSPLRQLPAPDAAGPLVLPVGDALLNPFWPSGLGVNRGFHSSLDAVWSVYVDKTQGRAAATAERHAAWKMMQWTAFHTTSVTSGSQWQADPLTRYADAIPKSIRQEELTKPIEPILTPRMVAQLAAAKK